MWRRFLVFVSVLAVCYCEGSYNLNVKKKPYKHHHHDPFYGLLYGGGFLTYFTFLLIKVKIIVVLGTIFTIFLVGGKIWALIRYFESAKTKYKPEPEKIYIPAPMPDYHHHHHGHHDFDGPISYSAPVFGGGGGGGGDLYGDASSYSPAFLNSPGLTFDKLPPNAEVVGGAVGPPHSGGRYIDSYGAGTSSGGGYYQQNGNAGNAAQRKYGRSYDTAAATTTETENNYWNVNWLYEQLHLFLKMIPTLNLTDAAFNSMKLTTDECKRKFVCRADFAAKRSTILATGLKLLRDESYEKYRTTNKNITSLDDCDRTYPECQGNDVT